MAFAVSPDWSLVVWTAVLFAVVELVTSNLIEPWFYGQRTGVSPLAVIVSAMFWTWLWGPMGLIIATPLTVCLVVIGHHVPSLRLFPIMLGDAPVLAKSARLYDRLLAGHSLAFTAWPSPRRPPLRPQSAIWPTISTRPPSRPWRWLRPTIRPGLLADHQTARIAHAAWTLTEEIETVVEDELALPSDTPVEGDATLITNGVLDGIGHRVAVMGAQTGLDDAAAQMLARPCAPKGPRPWPCPTGRPCPGRWESSVRGC